MLLLASTNLPIQFGDESKPIKFDIQLNQHLGSIPVPGLEDSFPHVPPKKLVIFRDYVTCGGFLKLGVPWNHPFEKDIAKPSILGYVGGDFTRSWLSLPLWHSTKVKGGKKKKTFWGIPHLWKPPFIFIYHSGNTDFARLELKWPSWYTTTGCGSWATSFNGIAMEIFSGLVFSGRIFRKTGKATFVWRTPMVFPVRIVL